jgi:hypothetical protein
MLKNKLSMGDVMIFEIILVLQIDGFWPPKIKKNTLPGSPKSAMSNLT